MNTAQPPGDGTGDVVDFAAFRARRRPSAPAAAPEPSARDLAEATNHPVVHRPDRDGSHLSAVPDPVRALRNDIAQREAREAPLLFPSAESPEHQADREAATRLALRLLGSRDATRKELRERLVAKEIDPEIAGTVAERLVSEGLIDEREIAERVIQVGVSRRHVGAAQLRRELRHRGIPDEITDEVLQAIPENEELQAAVEVATRRLRSVHGDALAQKRKVMASLQRKGFPSDLCRRAYELALQSRSDSGLDDPAT